MKVSQTHLQWLCRNHTKEKFSQATTLQLTPATEGRNQRGRGPTVRTPSLENFSVTTAGGLNPA
jgi:hypothetical protein